MAFEHCTLFTTALCNLNCGYCYICKDKAGGLQYIDKDVEDDFKNRRQIKQILDYDDSIRETLTGVTLWGGEPFLHVERFVDDIDYWFETFPNIKSLDTSTNFTIPNQVSLIENMLKQIDRLYHGEDKFHFDLQISIDGYEEMNDAGRGKGTTQKFLKNFRDLCKMNYNYDKIYIEVHTKPTLSKETFKYLESDEGILKWFNFFEKEMNEVYHNSNAKFHYSSSLWNCAQPTEWTQEDGIRYAKIIKRIQELSPEIRKNKYWSNAESFIPEAQLALCKLSIEENLCSMDQLCNCFAGPCTGGGCGAFTHNIVPIPKGYYTMCHRGIFDEYTDYLNNMQNKDNLNNLSEKYFKAQNVQDWILTKDQLKTLHDSMMQMYTHPNQIRYTDLVIAIREYALAGLIDKKYEDSDEIEKTLGYYLLNSYCIQDAYITNGSWTTISNLEIPLFYNGVMEIVVEEIDNVLKRRGWKL